MKIYVEAKSKADLIRRLSAGEEISGYNYSMFGGGGHYMLDDTLEDGTIIAIYSQMSGGNPVAKSWGTWTNGVLKAESFDSEEEKVIKNCQRCGGKAKMTWVQAKCSDLYNQVNLNTGKEYDGYVPDWIGIYGDYVIFTICRHCGQVQGAWPELDATMNQFKSGKANTSDIFEAEPLAFESPVSCKICGKTFASFRGLNGHMNAHIPTHRKRAEECEHEWKMTELPLERGHKYDVGWVNAAGITSYHMVCIKCNYCTECSGTHGFLAETFEQLPYEIITTDWKSSIAPEHRPNNDNWFITGDTIFAVPDSEGNYGRGEETIVRISTYGEGTTLDEAKENGIFRATEYLYDDYSRGYFTQNAETSTFEAEGEDEPTIEDFFRDMETTLNQYGEWDWDSEARDGVLGFSGNLTPTNGENFYQYDLDFDEMREDVSFEARGTSGWQVECSKCGVKGHNKATCGIPKPKPKARKSPIQKRKVYIRKTINKEDVRKNDFLKAIGAVVIGIFIGRNL